MKRPQGGGKSFMSWYRQRLDSDSNLDESVLPVLNAATYERGANSSSLPFVARFDGVWQLGAYPGLLSMVEKYVSHRKNTRLIQCLEDCEKVIFQSRFSEASARGLSEAYWNKPTVVICNPIRSEEVWSGTWVAPIESSVIRIVSYHRHTPLKCSYLSPEIAYRISENFGCPVELTIVGLDHRITRFYLESEIKKWAGRVTIRRLAGNVDVFVDECLRAHFVLNLAHFDPCPNVVCEAAGLGIPQILVKSGGIPEIVGRDYPFFIEPFAKYRSWLKKNDVSAIDWDSLFGIVQTIRNGNHRNIYDFANQAHNPNSVYSRYVQFARTTE